MIIIDKQVDSFIQVFVDYLINDNRISRKRIKEKENCIREWLQNELIKFPSSGRFCSKKCLGQEYVDNQPRLKMLKMRSYQDAKSKSKWWFSYTIIEHDNYNDSDANTFDIYVYRMCSDMEFANEVNETNTIDLDIFLVEFYRNLRYK